MKILCPIDFSEPSKVAMKYAFDYAKTNNTDVFLIHAVCMEGPGRADLNFKSNQILETMMQNAKEDWEKFKSKVDPEVFGDVTYTFEAVEGSSVEGIIESYAKKHYLDIIIMGTKGASGLQKLMGSKATAVIGNSSVPVITVPKDGKFDKFHELVYASDMKDLDEEIKVVVSLARKFDSHVHVLHAEDFDNPQHTNYAVLEKRLREENGYRKITMVARISDDVTESIEKYIHSINADLLVVFSHKPTWFERIFGGSVTREMAFHASTPLLSIKKHHTLR